MRPYDEKRQLINVGDTIEFENRTTLETISVSVIELVRFNDFNELYNTFDKASIGYDKDVIANPYDMEQYYSKEEQEKYGG